jgi:hypothetical protein
MVEKLASRFSGWMSIVCITVCTVASPTQAVVYPDTVNAHVDAEIDRYVGAHGFFQLDPDYFDSPEWNSLERFPFGDSPYTGYRDWGMSDAGKAIMALEAFEPALPHARYRVSVRNVDGNAEYPNVVRLIEVIRFNVGPALAANIQEIYGDQFTPSPEDVGLGRHVAYRFAMFSSQNLPNQIAAISYRFLSESEALAQDCLGTPCLALTDPGDEDENWTGISVDEDGEVTPYRRRDHQGLSIPTRVADLLSGQKLFGEDLDMVISNNVIGQDMITNGVMLRQDNLQLIRRSEVAGIAAFWSTTGHNEASGETGMIDVIYAFQDETEGPAWRYSLLFETETQPVQRYTVLTNGSNVLHSDGNTNFIGLADFPGHLYAHAPHDNLALAVWRQNADMPADRLFAIRVFDTGRREAMGQHLAHELRLVASLPEERAGTYRVWTGPIWAIPHLPSAPGLQTLPGSPFSGRARGLSVVRHNVADALAAHGLIARAEITLHTGISRERIEALLSDNTDNSRMSLNGTDRQTIRLRIGNLEQVEDGALGKVFDAPPRIAPGSWPGSSSAVAIPLLND